MSDWKERGLRQAEGMLWFGRALEELSHDELRAALALMVTETNAARERHMHQLRVLKPSMRAGAKR